LISMSVAIVSSTRTISLFCKLLAPPSPDQPSATEIIRAARVEKRVRISLCSRAGER
jgi:hypothetical protein